MSALNSDFTRIDVIGRIEFLIDALHGWVVSIVFSSCLLAVLPAFSGIVPCDVISFDPAGDCS